MVDVSLHSSGPHGRMVVRIAASVMRNFRAVKPHWDPSYAFAVCKSRLVLRLRGHRERTSPVEDTQVRRTTPNSSVLTARTSPRPRLTARAWVRLIRYGACHKGASTKRGTKEKHRRRWSADAVPRPITARPCCTSLRKPEGNSSTESSSSFMDVLRRRLSTWSLPPSCMMD